MAQDCHLLISDLFLPASAGAAPYDQLSLPALQTFLARGEIRRHPGASLESWLSAAFRVEPQHDQPLAAASLRGEGVDAGDAVWVRADPVHLKVRGDQLVLADASCLGISKDEASGMLTALNGHFRDELIEFIAPVPHRWYARLEAPPRIRTTPTLEVAGRSIERFLPDGEDGARWRRLINEVQMVLHQDARNEARGDRGADPVNSVWFWGAGRMPRLGGDAPYGAVLSDDPLAAGLAAAAGLPADALRDAAAALQAAPGQESRPVLIVLDRMRGAALHELHAWRAALAELEERWFAPLLEALRRGSVATVTLHALGPDFCVSARSTRLERFKFWRPKRPLVAYLPA